MAKKKRKMSKGRGMGSLENSRIKISMAWRNFNLFMGLFLVALIFYHFSVQEIFLNFFGILSAIMGFVALAFLIVLVTLILTKPHN